MSGRRDRSLEVAWGVGLAVAIVAGGITVAAEARSRRDVGALPAMAPAATPVIAAVPSAPPDTVAVVGGTRGSSDGEVEREPRFAAPAEGPPPSAEVAPRTQPTRHPSIADRRASARQRAWADSVLATLSPRARIGQLFLRWIPGTFRDSSAKDLADARRWIGEDSIGGFIISIGSPAELAAKTNALQRLSRVPLFFAADLEFGPGQRLIPGGAVFPPPMGIAATGDTTLSCAHGRITAQQARAVGITWAFAPDVDVNSDPANPIVNTRAYSDQPDVVTRFAVPFIRCAEAAGLLTTAKHFAAHGAAHVDSHIATPVVALSRARLDRDALAPFRAAQRAGVSAIMSAHVALPALSGDSIPVSLNDRVLRRLLRDEWGYDGIIVTDALWMGGATSAAGDPGELAVRAILAGNDVILDPADHRAMIDALTRAVGDGTISQARLDSSVRRVLIAKARVGLDRARFVDESRLALHVASAAADSTAALAARRSLVFARGSVAASPLASLRRGDTVRVFGYLDEGEEPTPTVRPGAAFVRALRELLGERGVAVESALWTAQSLPASAGPAIAAARRARAVVLVPYVRPLALKGTIGLPPAASLIFGALLGARADAVAVSFGDPYLSQQLPRLRTHLLAWNPWSPWAERAAARVLAGATLATGTLPISLPRRSARRPYALSSATAVDIRDSVRRVLDRAIADSAFPAAIAVVGTSHRLLVQYAAGRLDQSPGSPAPDEHTVWDLASLTKVVATTPALMQLVESGRVALDAPIQRYLPGWTGPGKEGVTVRHLLTHSSGLPAFEEYFRQVSNPGLESRDRMLALVHDTPLDSAPGATTVYSDVGAILLGEIVEAVSGERIDRYARRHVFDVLGMSDTRFLAVGSEDPAVAGLARRAAATEIDPWRGRHVRGEVHDENAYALGGVAGHAGLFGTAHDLARYAQALLGGGQLGGARVFRAETLAEFVGRVGGATASSRALGWDTATGENSAGHFMSRFAFGHTGFTGTSLWVDPANDVFVLLLSNRVNPTRRNQKIAAVRVELADAVMQAILPRPVAGAPPAEGAPTDASSSSRAAP